MDREYTCVRLATAISPKLLLVLVYANPYDLSDL